MDGGMPIWHTLRDVAQKNGLLSAQVWALYDTIDGMPRTWVRVEKVHRLGIHLK
jgi:hypothetical protein